MNLTRSPLPVNMGTWNSKLIGGLYHNFEFFVFVTFVIAVKVCSVLP